MRLFEAKDSQTNENENLLFSPDFKIENSRRIPVAENTSFW
jgi:hypothetical protein